MLACRALVQIPGTQHFRAGAQWVGQKCGPPSASPCRRFRPCPSDPTLSSGPFAAFRVVRDMPLRFFLRVFSLECLNVLQKEGGKPGVSLEIPLQGDGAPDPPGQPDRSRVPSGYGAGSPAQLSSSQQRGAGKEGGGRWHPQLGAL